MKINKNSLYNANCMDLLERIDPKTIKLVYIDLPIKRTEIFQPTKLSNEDTELRVYLLYLSQIFQQSYRILSDTGCIFFHSDPTTIGSTRLLLDQLFGRDNYQIEYTLPTRRRFSANKPALQHETILVYGKTTECHLNQAYRPFTKEEIRQRFSKSDSRGSFMLAQLTSNDDRPNYKYKWKGIQLPENKSWRYSKEKMDSLDREGRIYLGPSIDLPKLKYYIDESKGIEIGSVWDDILPLHPANKEFTKQPGQRPLSLLKRIIEIGSDIADTIVDPFCGTGTSLLAAHELNRLWVGCDSSDEACKITLERLSASNISKGKDFDSIETEILKQVPIVYNIYNQVITGLKNFSSFLPKKFMINQPISIEETRHFEFKEIKGKNPIDSIVNAADEYAVAYLNSEGGLVLWGIKNDNRTVVGVTLSFEGRDKLRRLINEKLIGIKPKVDPTQYRIYFHEVCETYGVSISDLWVIELKIPSPMSPGPYFTSSNELFVKIDGAKKKLEGPELSEWIMRRQRNN